jgi:hypothetical protein
VSTSSGTDGSNPAPSSEESAANSVRSFEIPRSGLDIRRGAAWGVIQGDLRLGLSIEEDAAVADGEDARQLNGAAMPLLRPATDSGTSVLSQKFVT